eukprot:353361-Chlamydomonas_euryale.AAC.9
MDAASIASRVLPRSAMPRAHTQVRGWNRRGPWPTSSSSTADSRCATRKCWAHTTRPSHSQTATVTVTTSTLHTWRGWAHWCGAGPQQGSQSSPPPPTTPGPPGHCLSLSPAHTVGDSGDCRKAPPLTKEAGAELGAQAQSLGHKRRARHAGAELGMQSQGDTGA